MLSSKEVEEIKKIKGQIRGVAFKNDFDYIKKKQGQKGVEKITKRLKELGCEDKGVCQANVKAFSWYPLWYHVLLFVILHKEMDWTKKDISGIGSHGAKVSLILKIFPKSMFDLKRFFSKAPVYWNKYFSVGKANLVELDLEKKLIILELKDFDVHHLECSTVKGYLEGLMRTMVETDKVKVEEIKCLHKGDDLHQFKITWK